MKQAVAQTSGQQAAVSKKRPPRMVEVVEVLELSPAMRRVVLGGASLAGLPQCAAAAHIKLFFPRPGQSEPRLPEVDRLGRVCWPASSVRPVVRTYSVRGHEPARERITVDFVLHEPSGPASDWARRARPGMRIGLAGPGGPAPMLPPSERYLLVGDLSALPAISALMEALPDHSSGHAFVFLERAEDLQVLRGPAGMEVCYLLGDGTDTGEGELLAAVKRLAPWARGAFAWLAGENAQVLAVRDYLLQQRGFAREQLYAVPYWKRQQSEEAYHEERHRIMDEVLAGRT